MSRTVLLLIVLATLQACSRCHDLEGDNINLKGTVTRVTTVIANDEEITAWVMAPLKPLCMVENGKKYRPAEVVVVPTHRMKPGDEYALTIGEKWEVIGNTWELLPGRPDGLNTAITFTVWGRFYD